MSAESSLGDNRPVHLHPYARTDDKCYPEIFHVSCTWWSNTTRIIDGLTKSIRCHPFMFHTCSGLLIMPTKEVVKQSAEYVKGHKYHVGKHYPTGAAHSLSLIWMAVKHVEQCSGHALFKGKQEL